LKELQVEMIDRFGLLPEPARNLFAITGLKLAVQPLGIRKIEAGPTGGRILFGDQPTLDPMRLIWLMQSRPKEFRMEGGDKLKFFIDLADPAQRVARVGDLIRQLAG
jgi:transcription-repair coupling factor (superfamily II helicase)